MLKRIIVFLFIIVTLSSAQGAFARLGTVDNVGNKGGLWDQLNRNLRKQQELRDKIAAAQSKERSLNAEISYINNQIELTRLEIEETKTRLEGLAEEITDVSGQLDDTKENLEFTQGVSEARLRAIYKGSFSNPLDYFLGATSFNDFLTKQKYTKAIRDQDLQVLEELENIKNEYKDQKALLEEKQDKEEDLKSSLEKKNSDLAAQQDSRRYILGITKDNEQTYQRLLAQVQSEIAAIARALGGGVRIGPVRRGQIVAFQGNTGCSTGTHLHFGLYVGGVARNPKPYLDSGALRWPESGPTVTQWYGANYWWYMNNFGIPGHNGIDMTKYYGAPIYAAASGTAYYATDGSRCWLTGTVGKGIVIHHSNGWKTIYWHIR